MKTIARWDDLCPYGMDPLTGEACGLGYRLLCDVTLRGKRLIEKAFGIKELVLFPNWNHGSEQEPHIGSVLLPPALLVPLAVFALLEDGCTEVWQIRDGGVVGIQPTDPPDLIEANRQLYAGSLERRFSYRGTAGDRNVHLMSGRVE